MRVAVINPWVCDFKLYDEWMHPLGLYILISLLHHNGIRTDFFNCLSRSATTPKRFGTSAFASTPLPKPPVACHLPRHYKCYGVEPALLARFLIDDGPWDAVFIGSTMTYWAQGVNRTIAHVRRTLPHIPIIVGGTAARLMPGSIDRIDSGVILCDRELLSPECTHLPVVGSLRSDGWERSLVPGLKTLPFANHGPVLLSLGCPLRCTYCASSVLHPGYEPRPTSLASEEVLFLAHRFGVRDFAFYDDALLLDFDTVLHPFLEEIRGSGLNLRFHTPNGLHLRLMTPTIARILKESGFATLRFGYESARDDHRIHTCGKSDRHAAQEAVAMALDAGFSPTQMGAYVMAGLPGQLPGEVIDELRFISSLGIRAMPVFVSPVPRTPLFEMYADDLPRIQTDPHAHNDTVFTSLLPEWGWEAMEEVRKVARAYNSPT